jgi:hypothetical protein
MILSDTIKPAQLKAFAGIVDFYRDCFGRTIARSWPRKSTTPNPNMMRTAARMTQMHSILKSLNPAWRQSWAMPFLPQGRTPTDLARQNVLWQLQNLVTPICPAITAIGHFYSMYINYHAIYFRVNPDYTIDDTVMQWDYQRSRTPFYSPVTWILTNQLFRRGGPSLRRPIAINPSSFNFASEVATPWPNWHVISMHWPTFDDFSGFIRPYWIGPMPPSPRTSSRSCYAPAPSPLPLAGPYPFGLSNTGDFPWV